MIPRSWMKRAALLAVCFGVTACGSSGSGPVVTSQSDVGKVSYTRQAVNRLPGWSNDRTMAEVIPAFLRSCTKMAALPANRTVGPPALQGTAGAWHRACAEAARIRPGDSTATRDFLESRFTAYSVAGSESAQGLFTGYYEAALDGSFAPGGPFTTPIYGVPDDLVMEGGKGYRRGAGGRLEPYFDRAAIEDGAMDGRAPVVMWARDPVAVFLMHIQGSGQVHLPNGQIQRIGYAANNGQPFVGIGGLMRDRGLGDGGSMPAIRAWLHANPAQGRALMRENPRFIFFRLVDGDGPIGAHGVPLTAERSLAVDTSVVPLGAPVWLVTTDAHGEPVNKLMVAQDTGSAIKGAVRGDLYWGSGEQALYHAGGMKSPGYWWVLIPHGGPGV